MLFFVLYPPAKAGGNSAGGNSAGGNSDSLKPKIKKLYLCHTNSIAITYETPIRR